MKKIVTGVLAAAVILAAGSFSAFAAGPGGGCACDGGICDYAGEVCHDSDGDGCRYSDEDGCRYFDEDGDGICDYAGDGYHHRTSGHHAPAGRGSLRHGHHGGHCR